MRQDRSKKSHDKTLNLVSLGDRRSHRGERYEFQIATKAEESYGFALQTCVKVTNIKYKNKVSVQQCPHLSKSHYYCNILLRKLSFLWSAGAEMSHEGWVQNAHKDRLIYQVA